MRNVPLRHRSIRVIFDHSWEILDPQDRDALARLSAYCGVFSREMAEQEAGADLATLSRLVNKSLLNRIGAGQFKLHNLVRQYAALRLHDGIDGSLPHMMPNSIFNEHHGQMESRQQSQLVLDLNDKRSIRALF